MKKITAKVRINKANGQININIKKSSIPEQFRDKKLKKIKLDVKDFEFDEW